MVHCQWDRHHSGPACSNIKELHEITLRKRKVKDMNHAKSAL